MKIHILEYTDFCNEEVRYYMPTKKAAKDHIQKEKKRGVSGDNFEIFELELETTQKGISELLNDEVGTGY